MCPIFEEFFFIIYLYETVLFYNVTSSRLSGNIPGTDSTLSDDLRMRTLASQWLAASGHPSAWLSQNPYGLHPGIATTTTSAIEQGAFPVPTPSGFKIAQDSLTGQLFLVPTGGVYISLLYV